MNVIVPLLLAELASAAAAVPRTPIAWILGARPAAGAYATYDTETRGRTFAGDPSGQGAGPKEVEFLQRTRVTFLYLGRSTAPDARGEWLEVQEEITAMELPGMPAGAKGTMVTRVLLGQDGKVLRVVSQSGGRPAEERAVGEGMAIAIGALQPFDALRGKLTTKSEKVQLGAALTATIATESGGADRVKLWKRTSDGVMVKLVQTSQGGTGTWTLVQAGTGGKTAITGEIRKAEEDPEIEAFRRMQAGER